MSDTRKKTKAPSDMTIMLVATAVVGVNLLVVWLVLGALIYWLWP